MTIKVLYFASLRERIGRAGDSFELVADSASITVEGLWQQTTGQNSFPDDLLVAVNQDYKEKHAAVSDGDEVAFFPPVTGG